MRLLIELMLAAAAIFCGVMWVATRLALGALIQFVKEKGIVPNDEVLDFFIWKEARKCFHLEERS